MNETNSIKHTPIKTSKYKKYSHILERPDTKLVNLISLKARFNLIDKRKRNEGIGHNIFENLQIKNTLRLDNDIAQSRKEYKYLTKEEQKAHELNRHSSVQSLVKQIDIMDKNNQIEGIHSPSKLKKKKLRISRIDFTKSLFNHSEYNRSLYFCKSSSNINKKTLHSPRDLDNLYNKHSTIKSSEGGEQKRMNFTKLEYSPIKQLLKSDPIYNENMNKAKNYGKKFKFEKIDLKNLNISDEHEEDFHLENFNKHVIYDDVDINNYVHKDKKESNKIKRLRNAYRESKNRDIMPVYSRGSIELSSVLLSSRSRKLPSFKSDFESTNGFPDLRNSKFLYKSSSTADIKIPETKKSVETQTISTHNYANANANANANMNQTKASFNPGLTGMSLNIRPKNNKKFYETKVFFHKQRDDNLLFSLNDNMNRFKKAEKNVIKDLNKLTNEIVKYKYID